MASDENTNTQLHSDTRKRKRSDGDGDGEGEGEGPTAPSLRGDGANWREAFTIGGGKEEGARTQAVALLVRWFDEEERTAGAVRLLDLIGSLQGDLNAQWLFPGIQRVYRRLYPDSPVRRKWAGLAAALILWRLHQKPHLPNKPQQVIGYLTLAKLTDALDSIAASSTLAEDTFLGRATEDTMSNLLARSGYSESARAGVLLTCAAERPEDLIRANCQRLICGSDKVGPAWLTILHHLATREGFAYTLQELLESTDMSGSWRVPFSGKKRFVVSAAVTEAAFRRHVVAPTSVYEKPFEWYGILENIEECFRPLYETVAAYLEGDLCRSRAKRARIVERLQSLQSLRPLQEEAKAPKAPKDRPEHAEMHAALWAHLQSKDIADIIACYAAGTAVTVWSAKPVTVDLRVDACGTLIDAATSVVARPYVPVETHAVFAECPRRGLLHHYVVELPSEDRSTVGSVSAVMLAGHEAVLLISKSTAPEGTWIFINGHPYLLGPQGSFLTPADGHSDADITLKTARQFYLCTSATYGVPSLLGPANAAYFVGDTLYEYPPPRDAASASGRTLVGGHLQAVRRSATSAVAATDPLLPWRWSSLPDKLVLRGGVRLHLQGTIGFQWPGAVGIQCADRDTSFSVDGDLTAPEGRIVLDARRGAGIAVAGAAKARVDVSIAVEGGGGGGGGASSKVRVGGALQCKSATLHTEGAAVLELDGGVSVASVLTVNGSAWSEVRIAAGGSPYRVYHTIITLRDSAKCWAPVRTEVLHLNLADSAALLEGPVVRHEARGKVAGASRAAITYLSSHRFATKVSVAESAKLDCGPHPSVTTNWQ